MNDDSSEARQIINEKSILHLARQKHDYDLFSALVADFIHKRVEAF